MVKKVVSSGLPRLDFSAWCGNVGLESRTFEVQKETKMYRSAKQAIFLGNSRQFMGSVLVKNDWIVKMLRTLDSRGVSKDYFAMASEELSDEALYREQEIIDNAIYRVFRISSPMNMEMGSSLADYEAYEYLRKWAKKTILVLDGSGVIPELEHISRQHLLMLRRSYPNMLIFSSLEQVEQHLFQLIARNPHLIPPDQPFCD